MTPTGEKNTTWICCTREWSSFSNEGTVLLLLAVDEHEDELLPIVLALELAAEAFDGPRDRLILFRKHNNPD